MKIYPWLSIPVLTLSCLAVVPAIAGPFDRPDFFERGRREFEEEIRRFDQQSETNTSPSLTVDEAALPWSRVVVNSVGFTAMLPSGALTNEVEVVESPNGDINFDIIASHPPSSRYVIAYSEEVTPERVANSQEVLEKSRDYIIENKIDLNKVADDDITFDKHPGREFKLQNKDETIIYRLLLVEQRLYILAVSQHSDAISEKSVATFFDSFELID
ncbi:hypothetical protein Xen7305DRAFT_00023230 [Xenococcus sp. PCC 7305]|uniref:hypothetical protein n=1 Tax=Xenococcus sp. PCC 7305 TaxID=102125 RepID=UPI0002AD1A4D|nr:hypothetical protein [Xenococcus sp. PCC 7305]ELS02605.1 hypothetical protein Xen7305DRAFT_00023230 [Xenococcus sp. PCC 7305]